MKILQLDSSCWAIIILMVFLTSCDSFVEVDLPKSQLINTTVFEDYATADAALTDIYAKIRDKGLLAGTSAGISNKLGNYADELVAYGTISNPNWNFYNNNLLPTTADIAAYWNNTYNQIYAANAVIEGATNATNLSPNNKNQLKGEALFIRALLHFYMTNLFGDIPYITDTDYRKNSVVSRMATATVYQHVISDLEVAIPLLPTKYSSLDRVRPNQYTAKALLARVYLYSNQYAEAANEASVVLNETELFSLLQDPNQVFLLNAKETIWQLQTANAGQNTDEAAYFIFLSVPPPVVSLNTLLVNSFASNDLRKTKWIKAVPSSTTIWYHAYKYKERDFTATSKEYSIVFRLAEQYLIRAEARAKQGDLIGAKEDLNKIRNRAGLSNTLAITQAEIVDAIMQERRWELFTEQGHRFFDLKRNNLLDTILSVSKSGWSTTDRLFPIPQTELITNPNLLPQNPGY